MKIKYCLQCNNEMVRKYAEAYKTFEFRKFCNKKCCDSYKLGKKTGYKHTDMAKKKISERRKGIIFTNEHIENLRKSHIGKKLSKESISKRSILQSKENHYLWKGNDVGYAGVHVWINRWYGKPDTCEHCNKSGLNGRLIHWANVSGQYKRERSDWLRLCAKCHKAYDMNNKERFCVKNNRFNLNKIYG